MLFNSYLFILCFLPICLCGYFALNKIEYRLAQGFLLGMSLWFYGYYNPWYLLLIGASVAFNYLFSRLLSRGRFEKNKIVLTIAILFNVGLIFYYKYFDFFIENINAAFNADFVIRNIALPLGISFFTFQQISYVVDSYKGATKDYNFLEYALFVTYFPQLIAGPIVLHSEMISQFRDESRRKPDYERLSRGVCLFTRGLAKKVLIADTFDTAVAWGFSNVQSATALDFIVVSLAYTFQIYFDFSGYSDMATGLASMFGFDLTCNFDSPYKSLSVPEFWRRWHMTLTRFLRTYIYFPLGGSRKGTVRTYVNIMIVYLVSGIWHGANWTFILWGILHGIANCIGRAGSKIYEKLFKPVQWFITFAFVNFAWLLFRADSVSQWLHIMHTIIDFDDVYISEGLGSTLKLPYVRSLLLRLSVPYTDYGVYIFSIVIILILALVLCLCFENNYNKKYKYDIKNMVFTVFLLVLCVVSLSDVSVFLYFNF